MMPFLIRVLKARELSIVLFLVGFFILVGSINKEFITGDTIALLIKSSAILLVMAIGQSFVLLTANIDVSVGSTMGLSAAVAGILLTDGYSLWIIVPAVLLTGVIVGLLNGLGIAYGKVPSIIMTLGMLGIIRGTMLLFTEGMWIEDIPNFYKELSGAAFIGISLPVWIAIVLVVVCHLYMTRTKSGRCFYAVGDNEEGAVSVGLPVKRVLVLSFIFSSVSASIAALLFVMNIGFVPNQTGSGMELQVIAAAVLGGVSLTGGIGSVIGAGLGAVFFTVISNSLVYLKIPAYYNDAISGFLLLAIVVGDSQFQTYIRNQSTRINRNRQKGDSKGERQTTTIT